MARNKTPYRAKLVNGMYRVKKSRVSKNRNVSDLESLVRKEVKETNKRLKRLEKPIDLNKAKYNPKTKKWERPNLITFTTPTGKKRIKTSRLKSFKGLYASKRLEDLGISKNGKVKLTGKESKTELINLHTELSKFLSNKTSLRKGVIDVFTSTTETIGLTQDVLPNEAMALYNVFVDPDFKGVQSYIKGSEFTSILNESVATGKSSDDFIEVIRDYISDDKLDNFDNDLDIKMDLKNIYSKYLSR